MHIDVNATLRGTFNNLSIFEGEMQVKNNCVFQCYDGGGASYYAEFMFESV